MVRCMQLNFIIQHSTFDIHCWVYRGTILKSPMKKLHLLPELTLFNLLPVKTSPEKDNFFIVIHHKNLIFMHYPKLPESVCFLIEDFRKSHIYTGKILIKP